MYFIKSLSPLNGIVDVADYLINKRIITAKKVKYFYYVRRKRPQETLVHPIQFCGLYAKNIRPIRMNSFMELHIKYCFINLFINMWD